MGGSGQGVRISNCFIIDYYIALDDYELVFYARYPLQNFQTMRLMLRGLQKRGLDVKLCAEYIAQRLYDL